MRLYGLRLLVALLTFAAGVAAGSLLNFKRTTPCMRSVETRSVPVSAPVVVEAPRWEGISRPTPPLLLGRPYTDEHGVINRGVLNGMALSKPQPAYPTVAKSAASSGTVFVRVLVNEEGRVVSAEAESGHPLLRQAAETAALRARFEPVLLSGRPVKFSGVLSYNFGLE
jgi:TonB family protein